MLIAIDKCFLLFVFVFASLLQCSFAQVCPTTLQLQNIAAYENESAAFTTDPNGAGTWSVIPSSTSSSAKTITGSSNTVTTAFVGIYEADSTHLTILNSTISPQGNANYSTAGLYILKYTNPACTTMATLVVVKSGPVCACNASNPNKVIYTCSAEFANNFNQKIIPIMTWKTSSGVAFTETPQPIRLDLPAVNPGRQSSTSQVNVTNTDTTTYECQMNFSEASFLSAQVAMNAPNFTASCYITNCALTTSNPTTTTTVTTTTGSTPTISDTTTANPTTTRAPLSTTAELLSTTATLTSATTSFASTTYVATSSLPITTYSSNESEAQAVITVLAVALGSISTLTLVMLSWWFCLCQIPAATALPAAKALATPRFIPRIREVNPWSFYSQKGIYDGREANPWSFYSRRGMYEGREADPWSFYSRGGMYEGRQSSRPRYESYERY